MTNSEDHISFQCSFCKERVHFYTRRYTFKNGNPDIYQTETIGCRCLCAHWLKRDWQSFNKHLKAMKAYGCSIPAGAFLSEDAFKKGEVY
jgi:hypothetical protein